MLEIVFYFHLLAATSWIGGSMFLFALGIGMRDKQAQKKVYYYIGPLYGYFESVMLAILLTTGGYMMMKKNLLEVIGAGGTFESVLVSKIILVGFITFATIVHMYISMSAHGRERSNIEKFISRGTSLMIFVLNLFILWFAIQLRNFL